MQELKTTVINYGEGIFAIDQQMVRAFLIVGEKKAILLDTGAIKVDILKIISEITQKPLLVIITHGDGDHIGNLSDFSEAYVHVNDQETVRSHAGCEKVVLHQISENDEFDIGGRTLKTLFTPGHTAGSISLLDEENKILFAGDTISYGPVFMFGKRRDMAQFLDTLKRLKSLKDGGEFTKVYCCHNACPIEGSAIDDLIGCVSGILNGTIESAPAQMPLPSAEKPFIAKFGKCAVLFDK